MKLSDLIFSAQYDGLAAHNLREHCATNFLKTFEALKHEHEKYIDLIGDDNELENHCTALCEVCKLIADLDNVENFK